LKWLHCSYFNAKGARNDPADFEESPLTSWENGKGSPALLKSMENRYVQERLHRKKEERLLTGGLWGKRLDD
jgi:hypothetical protein